jgi:hypothetical protein
MFSKIRALFAPTPAAVTPEPSNADPDPADDVERAFAELYPTAPPKYFNNPGVHAIHDLTRTAPLADSVACFRGEGIWHLVTLGISGNLGGLGYELTLRLPRAEEEEAPPLWAVDLLFSLSIAANKGSNFAAGHTAKTGPLDGRPSTQLIGLVLIEDDLPAAVDTKNGRVHFLLVIGIDGAQHARAQDEGHAALIAELKRSPEGVITRLR